jgi:hypothetical protein
MPSLIYKIYLIIHKALKIKDVTPIELPISPDHKQRHLNFYVTNVGKSTAKSCWFNLYIPKRLGLRYQGNWSESLAPAGLSHIQLNQHMIRRQRGMEEISIHPGQDYDISAQKMTI